MSNKYLIIINPQQFGLNTDYVMYAKYLSQYYTKVRYLTIDQGFMRTEEPLVEFHYISRCAIKQISYAVFFIYTICFLFTHSGAVMTSNFAGCRWLKKIMPWRRICVNIRTVCVNHNQDKANKKNIKIRKDVLPFDRIIMISEGGARQLHLPQEKTAIVSLGADVLSSAKKVFDVPRLLYVGTLTGRNILQTVQGLHMFLQLNITIPMPTYDIIGIGDDFDEIRKYIQINALQDIVRLHGFIPYSQLSSFMDTCNIGVSYVPITDGFMFQPPTKTFEYINSGLFCIATATKAQRDVISTNNGLLINDTAEDFCRALVHFVQMKDTLNEDIIRKSGTPYLWKNIIEKQLLPALNF